MKLLRRTMEEICEQIASAEREYPKASVYFDTESLEIRITYPTPGDFEILVDFSKKTNGFDN